MPFAMRNIHELHIWLYLLYLFYVVSMKLSRHDRHVMIFCNCLRPLPTNSLFRTVAWITGISGKQNIQSLTNCGRHFCPLHGDRSYLLNGTCYRQFAATEEE